MQKAFKEKENLDFRKEVIYKTLELTCTKNTPLIALIDFVRNNIPIPDWYGYNKDFKNSFTLGIIELIENAIRASAEKDTNSPIKCVICYEEDAINFQITNGAGGFDLEKTLYNPKKTITVINKIIRRNINGEVTELEEIRECSEVTDEDIFKYNQSTGRGGFGLIMSSKIFKNFNITFLDDNDNEMDYTKGETKGTKITFKINKKRSE